MLGFIFTKASTILLREYRYSSSQGTFSTESTVSKAYIILNSLHILLSLVSNFTFVHNLVAEALGTLWKPKEHFG